MEIDRVVRSLSIVPGIMAVALGGSRSRGEAAEHSDYDIGVYYDAASLDLPRLGQCLKGLDDNHREGLLNPPGEWGPWINGGAWLTVYGMPVDILLRDIARVEEVIADCVAGRVTIDYQCGHPFGFVNAIYAAEIHHCKPLWQHGDRPVDKLKAMLSGDGGYPIAMRQAIVGKFLWEAQFSLACGRKPAFAGELNYAMGSIFRAVCAWAEVLHAINGKYLMNEKGALRLIEAMERRPEGMDGRVRQAYGLLAAGKAAEAYAVLDQLQEEIKKMADMV